ncbi:MAG TPA: glycosyltransferase family 87 protein [Terracidiphilus sp.]
MSLKRTNQTGLAWILLACGISILWGSTLGPEANRWVDFKAVYYGTRCLIEHHNPYSVSELDSVYRSEGGKPPSESVRDHIGVTLYVNLPATFLFVAPFALLPWGPAHVLWMTLTAGVFILAALLTWNLAAGYSSRVTLFLLCILLANCEAFFVAGNTAGIVVSLCVVAVWCLLKERFVPAGILCLALSLAIKPHDAGLVWLYFLLAGGIYRKRALQSLFITAILSLSAFLWVSHVAPHWIGDWQNNMAAISSHGGLNDPSLDSLTGRVGGMVIDLQSALSVFRDDPRFYNPVSYLVCGALLLIWSVFTLRSRFSLAKAWIALAVAVPLTMLVTYHRPWDAKLLLLTIPACAMLWARGGATGWIALLLNGAGIVMTADLPLTLFIMLANNMQIPITGLPGQVLTAVLMRPVPLILLAMSIFYLWVYLRRDPLQVSTATPGEPRETPLAQTRA